MPEHRARRRRARMTMECVHAAAYTMAMRTHALRCRVACGLGMVIVVLTVVIGGCGDDAGKKCSTDADCDGDGLSCLTYKTGAVRSGGSTTCDFSPSVCTKKCSSDSDCDGKCSLSSTCGGKADLCGKD